MKKAFLITSAIDIDNNHPLTYSKVRTAFDPAERFRQTAFTVASLDLAAREDSTFFLIDISDNYEGYKNFLSYQTNLVYVSVKQEMPEIYNTVRTHPNKSHCETLLLLTFLLKYKAQLKEFDYFFKVSGRYFIDSNFNSSLFNDHNTDKIFFKKPLKFEWVDSWNYQMVDRRADQGDNFLYQYCSVLYGWGKEYHDKFVDIFHAIEVMTSSPSTIHYDVETLLYHYTREFKNNILETDWIVYGWDGTNGTFLRY